MSSIAIPKNIINISIPVSTFIERAKKYALFGKPIKCNLKFDNIKVEKVNILTFLLINLNSPDSAETNMVLVDRYNIKNEYKENYNKFKEYARQFSEVPKGKLRKKFFEVINVYIPEVEAPDHFSEMYLTTGYKELSTYGLSKIIKSLFSPHQINRFFSNYTTGISMNKPSSLTYKSAKLINTFIDKNVFFNKYKKVQYENFKDFEESLYEFYTKTLQKISKNSSKFAYKFLQAPHLYFGFIFTQKNYDGSYNIIVDAKAKGVSVDKKRNIALYDFYYRGYNYILK